MKRAQLVRAIGDIADLRDDAHAVVVEIAGDLQTDPVARSWFELERDLARVVGFLSTEYVNGLDDVSRRALELAATIALSNGGAA